MSESAEPTTVTGPSRWFAWLLRALPLLLGGACVAVVQVRAIPLGIAGEWVWNRMGVFPHPGRWLLPIVAFAGYLAVVAAGCWVLRRWREWVLIALFPALLGAGGVVQLAWLDLPPPPWGIERWPLSLASPASSGYFTQAAAVGNLRDFLAEYERWIAQQDSFHVGTHPPGLFVLCRFALDWFAERPQQAQVLVRRLPERLRLGFSALEEAPGLSRPAQAAVGAWALMTFAVALTTAIPVYGLCRLGAAPVPSWLAAAFWPLVPAIPLFLPVGDCLYPPIAALVVLLVLWSAEIRLAFPAVVAGLVFWIGMLFSLAFLAVLPIAFGAHFTYFWHKRMSVGRWLSTWAAFAAGAALPTEWCWRQLDLNLPVVWFINLDKHAGFYLERPMSYWPWLGLNLIEFAFVCGPVVMGWFLAALVIGRRTGIGNGLAGLHWAAAATLLLLDAVGRNRGEVGRLWMLLIPFVVAGLARAASARPGAFRTCALWLFWQALIGWILTASVEPLLPVALPDAGAAAAA